MAKNAVTVPPKVKLPFLKGREFDLCTSLIAVLVVLVLAVQIPLGATTDGDTISALLFTVIGLPVAVSALMIRHGVLTAQKRDRKDPQYGNVFYRWFFIWLLIPTMFVVLLPWIVTGSLSDKEINAFGVSAIILLLPWVSLLAGFLVAALVIYPIEATLRSLGILIKTGGKKGLGGLIIGAYLLVVLAFITCGSLAASAILPGQAGHGALLAALFGIPGGYTIKDASFLWPARILGIVMVIVPLVFGMIRKKYPNAFVIREITSKLG